MLQKLQIPVLVAERHLAFQEVEMSKSRHSVSWVSKQAFEESALGPFEASAFVDHV